jgi:GNAT superfamily N-acetyltransferase
MDEVIALSKRHQRTLGQLPFEAFQVFAAGGRVLAAWSGGELAGYVIYRSRKRSGVVVLVHLCVAEAHRGDGHGDRLVDAVCEANPYAPGLAAWCREDYPAHNRWPTLGFERTGSRLGRGRDGKQLIHWWRPINELTLFTYVPEDDEGPVAAIDTNVFRDIVEPRPQFAESVALAEPWLMDSISLVVTGQLVTEIEEACAALPGLRGTAERFPKLPARAGEWRPIYSELSAALSETSIEAGDCRQLAQACVGGARYFVTRDGPLLSNRDAIEAITGVHVLTPLDLTLATHAEEFEITYRAAALRESELEIRHPAALPPLRDLVPFTDHQRQEKTSTLARELRSVAGKVVRGARLWELGPTNREAIAIAATSVDGSSLVAHCVRVRSGVHQLTFARQILHILREEAVSAGLARVRVEGATPDYLAAALVAEGYVTDGDLWIARCQLGLVGPGDSVPHAVPPAQASDLNAVEVAQLERVLWPLKIVGGNTPTYIVPIQPAWARSLFDEAPLQAELFPRPAALSLAREHVYYRSLNRKIKTPARILWWVSGGGSNSGMRATSWLESSVTGRPRTLHRQFGSQGVYQPADVEAIARRPGAEVSALVFSRTEVFQNPLPIAVARRVYPPLGANGYLQTAREVDEHVFVDFYQIGTRPR